MFFTELKCEKGDVAIRIYGDKTEMFIDRDREASALKTNGRRSDFFKNG